MGERTKKGKNRVLSDIYWATAAFPAAAPGTKIHAVRVERTKLLFMIVHALASVELTPKNSRSLVCFSRRRPWAWAAWPPCRWPSAAAPQPRCRRGGSPCGPGCGQAPAPSSRRAAAAESGGTEGPRRSVPRWPAVGPLRSRSPQGFMLLTLLCSFYGSF